MNRIQRLQSVMEESGVDLTLLSVGADLRYFTGYDGHPSERLTAWAVGRSGAPILLVPQLEAPKVVNPDGGLIAWGETENPVSVLAEKMGEPKRVAVGDHMWSVFLLRFQEQWRSTQWVPASNLTRQLRVRKDQDEIGALRQVGAAVDMVMARIPEEVRFSGRTETEVARQIAAMCIEEGHDTVDFTIVASGPNGASPHHSVSDRTINQGDMVVCDFGGQRGGYFSDTTRTFCVGAPSQRQREVHAVVEAAQAAGRAAVRPGVSCQDIDRATRAVVESAGFGDYFVHRTGHGIGMEVHEHPYLVEGNEEILEPGMAFSIEPGIYLPDQFGVRIEDIAVCTNTGIEVFNNSDRGLNQVA